MNQRILVKNELHAHRNMSRKAEFLSRMDKLVPWSELCAVIEPFYQKVGDGLCPVSLERMLRMYFIANWFNLADEGCEDALYDTHSFSDFCRIDFGLEHALDATTLKNFRRLLEQHELEATLFTKIGELLLAKGLKISRGTIVDATLNATSSLAVNDEKTCAAKPAAQLHFRQELPNQSHGNVTRIYSIGTHNSQLDTRRQTSQPARTILLTLLAMIAFAGNSLLCRFALNHTSIDAASFTTLRLVSGALMLLLVVRSRGTTHTGDGNWLSAVALFAFAAGFSFAYVSLSAATGSLLLFCAVQVTMIGYSLWSGERLLKLQVAGLLLACGGLVGLLMPGLSAPPLFGSLLMLGAGIAWGIYSLRGKNAVDPTRETAGNFFRVVPIAAALSLFMLSDISLDNAGIGYAVLSGALTSGIGFAIWYRALPALKAAHASTVQLSVPVIAALGGIVFLGEPMTLHYALTSVAVLAGIALVIFENDKLKVPTSSITGKVESRIA